MDILATQVYEDDSFTPTQQASSTPPHRKEKHIGTLSIGSINYPIEEGITKIGRHPECDIVLNDQTVSKKHAEIEVENGESWICDLNSSNKTRLNSTILKSGRYYQLKGGSVVKFGMVRAVYSVLDETDESFIAQTPINHMLSKEMTIPMTPNCSSSSVDISIVQGTQPERGDPVFRRPSAPLRTSVSGRRSYIPDSSSDDSMNDSRDSSALGKENLDENRVSTHDMETQNSFEPQSNLSDDIHDVETQKICLDSFLAAKQSDDQSDIHSVETQHEESVDSHVTDIHDVDTQHDVDIDDLNMPAKTEVQNTLVKDDEGANAVEKGQTEEVKVEADVSMQAGKSEIKEGESSSNAVDRPEQAVAAKDENSGNTEQLKIGQRRSQDDLDSSTATNFDDECSDLDRRSSQDLLANLNSDDESVNESGLKSINPPKSPANNDETTEKSSDEENIFDMATQANANNDIVIKNVTKRTDYTFEASLMEDDSDDDTDQEAVFQRYSRIASQDSSQGTLLSKSQPDSDDSVTDEEGHFAAMAPKEKRTSVSFNESKERKNDAGTSWTSEDLFDIATQKVNLDNYSKEQADVSKGSVDFNAPTQMIDTNQPVNVTEKDSADFDSPTQIIEVSKPEDVADKVSVDFDTPTQVIDTNEPVNVTEKGSTDFDSPTQIIEVSKPEDVADKVSVDFDTPTQVIDTNEPVNVTEKGSTDFDSPTQIIEVSKPEDVANNVSVDFDTPKQVIDTNEPVNVTEKGSADFDSPTQIIEVSKPEDVANKVSVDFDTPTQVIDTNEPVNVTEEGRVSFDTPTQIIEVSKPEDVANNGSVDFDTPKQVIDTNEPVNVTEEGRVSFDTPTQIIEVSKPEDVANNVSVDFDTPKQVIDTNEPVNVTEKGSADFDSPTQIIEVSKPEDVANKVSVDFDTPTQVIDTNEPVNVTEEGRVSFDTPTQIIEVSKPEDVANNGSVDFDTPKQVIDTNEPVNVTEKGSADFDSPTQIIEVSKPEDVANKVSVDFDTPTQVIDTNEPVNVTEEGRVSFDTPTQIIEVSKPEDVANKVSVDFDTPTQVIDTNEPVIVTEKGRVSFDTPTQIIEVSKPEDVANKVSVDFDTPTQVIDINEPVNVTEKGRVSFDTPTQLIEDTNKDEDDLMPTQILPIDKISRNVTAAAKGNTTRNEDKDEGETDYNTPTQIIGEKVPIYNEPSPNDSETNSLLVEEFSMQDIDYEMAPTQLLTDIEEKKKPALVNKKKKSRKLNKVNMDDTVERNLNEMFEDVNEDIEDDQPQMSTQVLTNMLESPQSKEESADVNVDHELPGSSKEKTSPKRTKRKATEAKVELSPLLTSRKSRRSNLKKARTNDASQNYFSNLTTKRKRNLLVDSQELITIDEDEEIKTKETLNDENDISAALLKSSPKNSPSTRFSRTNKPKELQLPEPVLESVELVKDNKNVAIELDRGDEISITSVSIGQFGRSIMEDSDEDIMAGLPEVQISGTLSNPTSPTSSTSTEFRFTTRSTNIRSNAKKTEPKKKVVAKKSTGKSITRTNVENNKPAKVGRPRSKALSSSFDNSNLSRVPEIIYENDNDIKNEIKPSKRTSSRKCKESESLQAKPLCAEVRLSPSIQDNGRTRGSIKEYSSSVFQVGKEVLVATVSEPVRKTAVKTSTAVKRSLSSTDMLESNAAKKRKESVTEKVSVATKGRRSTRVVIAKVKHKILFTGITDDYSKLLAKLGSSQVEDAEKCTVLVTDKVRRTVKFLCALANAVPIVSVNWLIDSEKAGHFKELDDYILQDRAAEVKFGFKLKESLEKAKKQKLLDGYTIVLTPNVAPPPVQELKSIISSCGGKSLVRPPSSWPQNAVIISREEDMVSAKKFLAKASKTVTIQSTEFILTGILRQELNFVKYKLT